jgi:hypothetical protein
MFERVAHGRDVDAQACEQPGGRLIAGESEQQIADFDL